MATTPVIRYALDTTGLNSDNYIAGEPHILANYPIRAIVPTYGAFFTESLKVYDKDANKLLVRGTHYICTELATDPTELYAKEICYIIVVTDKTVSSNVAIDYQLLGGLYGRSTDAILSIYNFVLNGSSSASWPNIINKPAEFIPSAHLHDIADVYGFEYIVNAVERLRAAILIGSAPEFQKVLKYIDDQVTGMGNTVVAAQNALEGHVTTVNNPHATTKAQVGLGNVTNLKSATDASINTVINAAANASPSIIAEDAYVTVRSLLYFKNNGGTGNTADILAAAKTYADSKDVTVLQSAQTADAAILVAAKTFATNADGNVALTAKQYTDASAASTLVSANAQIKASGLVFPTIGGIGLTATKNVCNNSEAGRWYEFQLNGLTVTLPDITLTETGDTFTFSSIVDLCLLKTFSSSQNIQNHGTGKPVCRFETFSVVSNGPSGQWYITSNGMPGWTTPPVGAIIMYDGALATLPGNWKVCDGQNGTPNLVDRFVVAAGSKYAKGAAGGNADGQLVAHSHGAASSFAGNALGAHSHGVNDPTHAHSVYDPGHTHQYNHHYNTGAGGPVSLDDRMPLHADTTAAAATGIGIYGSYTGVSIQASAAGTPTGTVSTSITSTGVSATDTNLPPYYALFFIKRIY